MILCFSGGVDSFVAYHYLGEPQTIYFDLGTPYSKKELRIVNELVPSTIIDYSLRLGSRQIGEKAYVPFRNLYIAMLASKFSDDVVIVGIKGDNVSDKNPEIFEEFSLLLSKMEGRRITITSPFWDKGKSDLVRWYLSRGGFVDSLLKTVSCYSQEEINYCGKCPACFRKWIAFKLNGIFLEFENKKLMQEYYQAALNHEYDEQRNKEIMECVLPLI